MSGTIFHSDRMSFSCHIVSGRNVELRRQRNETKGECMVGVRNKRVHDRGSKQTGTRWGFETNGTMVKQFLSK